MASLIAGKNGLRSIQFKSANDGKRKTLRLGKMPQKKADTVLLLVERLVTAMKIDGGRLDSDTASRVKTLSDEMHAKFVAVGLLEPRSSATLEAFLDEYIARNGNVKPATRTVYGHTRRCLIEYFGSDMPLRRITAGDAEEWRHWLAIHEKLSDNTIRRRTGLAKQFFRAAVKKRLIDSDPFAELTARVQGNAEKFYFVTRDETQKVLDACPDDQWRLLFALSRFGGLRCPSEHLLLTWDDINWEQNRITVHSPKTEHHEGRATRVVPIFPELRPYLDKVYHEAPEGTVHVITRYRELGVNLRTHLLRIIAKAGLKPWPKLWHNLRATRQTELEDQFPGHVVCKWIGNSQRVADEHYLHVTEDHFRAAAACSALQKALQQPAITSNNADMPTPKKRKNPRENEGFGAPCGSLPSSGMGDEGLEPPTPSV